MLLPFWLHILSAESITLDYVLGMSLWVSLNKDCLFKTSWPLYVVAQHLSLHLFYGETMPDMKTAFPAPALFTRSEQLITYSPFLGSLSNYTPTFNTFPNSNQHSHQ